MASERETATIVIANITKAQRIAIEDMLATWMQLGSWGSSRWTAFFADGDGNFRPQITINDEKPKITELLKRDEVWSTGDHGEYRIDFDVIAWRLHYGWSTDWCVDRVCLRCSLCGRPRQRENRGEAAGR